MLNRRQFVAAASQPFGAAAALAFLHPRRAHAIAEAASRHPGTAEEVARDEGFWSEIQRAFVVDRTVINLNNGGVSPSPAAVQEAQRHYQEYSNAAPVYTMWRVLEPQRETVREKLARFFGCDPEEVALTRNTSEGLETCQFGFDLKTGDEVLTSNQDYPRMIATFRQRERREGIVLRRISLPTPAENPEQVVRLFEGAITPRTRLILVSQMIFLTGQVLPVREIVALGRRRGIPVLVDGAHAFAHLAFTHADLDCEYYATSLHKWLFAPHGTGMLYVRRQKIGPLWPLMAAPPEMDNDIRKFEEIGTHPAAPYLAIAEALAFTTGIGPQRKEARLRYLRDRWALRLSRNDRVRLHTSLKPGLSCGLALVQLEGIDSGKLTDYLWAKHRIIVAAIKHEEFEGIRVAPSVYTTPGEIDRFCEVVEGVLEKGLATT
ncbi:MAG TPA: aminotransferase class V-fold PLP-dependent enzyme [Thermoanaerobaculaceae bacterium]|nr:aminotransferase class V-fold PLP-dependent enzyme [Thermoanaerobaculaceae bacterium]